MKSPAIVLALLVLCGWTRAAEAKDDVLHVSGLFSYDHPANLRVGGLAAFFIDDSAGYFGTDFEPLNFFRSGPTLSTSQQQRTVGVRAGVLPAATKEGFGAGFGFSAEGLRSGVPVAMHEPGDRILLGAVGGELAAAANFGIVTAFVAGGVQRIVDDQTRKYVELQITWLLGNPRKGALAVSGGVTYGRFRYRDTDFSTFNFVLGGMLVPGH